MSKPGGLQEAMAGEWEMKQVSAVLHELCQPLTTLQCRLEMAKLADTPGAYREAVEAGLVECARMASAVNSMRAAVRVGMQHTADSEREPEKIGAGR